MTERKRATWTFQPDDDVVALSRSLFGEKPKRGIRTQFINEAIRFKHHEGTVTAAHVIAAQREVDEASARLERMKKMLSKIKNASTNSSSTSEEVGIFAAAEEASRPEYPSSSHSPIVGAPTDKTQRPSRDASKRSKGRQSSAKQVPK